MSADERWLPIPGCEGSYEASDMGRVRSLDRIIVTKRGVKKRRRGQVLKGVPHPRDRYLMVNLPIALRGRVSMTKIHHLVLEAFVGPRPAPEMDGCHANDIREDNRLSNLRWDTKSGNARDAVRNMRRPQQHRTRCPQGHPYTPGNTRVKPSEGRRRCKTCIRQYQRTYRARRRGLAAA